MGCVRVSKVCVCLLCDGVEDSERRNVNSPAEAMLGTGERERTVAEELPELGRPAVVERCRGREEKRGR